MNVLDKRCKLLIDTKFMLCSFSFFSQNYNARERAKSRLHEILMYLRSKVRLVDPFWFLACLFSIGIALSILADRKKVAER